MRRSSALLATIALSVPLFVTRALLQAQAPGECIHPLPGMVAWFPGDDTPFDIVGGRIGFFAGDVTYGDGQAGTGAFFLDGDSEVNLPARVRTGFRRATR